MRIMAPQPWPSPKNPNPEPREVRWQPKTDWLYRQYAAGVGAKADEAEKALRNVLGAAAGWIDRPLSEEETAALLVQMMPKIATGRESSARPRLTAICGPAPFCTSATSCGNCPS